MRGIVAAASALLLAVLAGCQPAERYQARPARATPANNQIEADNQPLDPEIQWRDASPPPKADVSIDFVHAGKAPEVWSKLPKFWNAPPLMKPGEAAAVLQIKVPLGLPDPGEYIPAGATLTLGKWKLGQQLFFDENWLEAKAGTSCATCHRPDHGFADGERRHQDGFNAPTLVNCVFNRWQFWDGRAVFLEEVVQQTPQDEKDDPSKPFHHAWSGVIARLRNQPVYHEQFNNVFGTPPGEENGAEKTNITQDTVGRALACYLRTLLAGDSIHDRAVGHAQTSTHRPDLKAEDYEAVLDDAALAELASVKEKKTDVATQLMRGYLLFHGRDKTRPLMNCYRCHSGQTFSDNDFHNLGIGEPSRPGREGGRFAQAPIGRKNHYLIDAYKTPTLRNLRRSGPYFHNGSVERLREVVEFFNNGAKANSHLDAELRGPNGHARLLGLTDAEIDAVVLFLTALNGRDVSTNDFPG